MKNKKNMLALAANPEDYGMLRLDKEVKAIKEALRPYGIRFEQLNAVTKEGLANNLLDHKPYMLHFCGHGEEQGIVLVDGHGCADLLGIEALTDLLKLCRQDFGLCGVVFNSCFTESLAASVVNYVPYVAGMSKEISDEAAILFAKGFYEAIGAGLPPDRAFHWGRNAILRFELPGHLTPVLRCNEDLMDTCASKEKRAVRLILDGDKALFEQEGKLRLLVELASLALGIEKEDIKVLQLWEGSVKILLELPEGSANELLYLFGKAGLREKTELFRSFEFTGIEIVKPEDIPREGRLQASLKALGEMAAENMRWVFEVFLPPPQLADPMLMHLGDEPETGSGSRAILNHPTYAVNVGMLYEKTGRAIPYEHSLYEAYNIFLLEYSFEMDAADIGPGLINLGFQAAFEEKDDVIIVDMLPQNRFFTRNSDENHNVAADLRVNGRLALPSGSVALSGEKEELISGGYVLLSSTDHIVGRIHLDVPRSEVTASGIGSHAGEWIFQNMAETSLKHTFTMAQLILINKTAKEIELKTRIYATATTFDSLPERRESEWVRHVCHLPKTQ
ncbi:MAG: CHAT domain-containing protein [Phaeodactylibacter sp.]|nr:CHAT domain-containing protein [Phaeodactylibacter sp.]